MSLNVSLTKVIRTEIYDAKITHNLNKMAEVVNLYKPLWRPDEIGIEYAYQLIDILEDGLLELKRTPNLFNSINPENGWGSYDGLVKFVENYLEACKKDPDAKVEVSR